MRGGYLGVDVFLVLSGYLITGILVDEVSRTGTISLVNFWARRARRLLPAATLIVLVVLAVNAAFLSPFEQISHAHTARAFAVYASNLLFAYRSTNYFAPQVERDPLLHTWSLSVEEQFYLFFAPILFLLARSAVARGNDVFLRRFKLFVIVASVASFAACVAAQRLYPVIAFYVLPTRAWEFGVGALAVLATRAMAERKGPVLEVVSFGSLVALIGVAATLGQGAAHPGFVTLIPTLGTVALILTGASSTPTVTTRLLSSAPMRALGRWSYSWYLWHWPVLVYLREVVPDPSLGLRLLVAFGSLIPAAITYKWYESPIRFSRWLQRYSPQVAIAAVVLAIGTLTLSNAASSSASAALESPRFAAIVGVRNVLPTPYGDGCHLDYLIVNAPACTYGAPSSDTTVVLFGDSHAAQWFPALLRVAEARRWTLASLTKSGCASASVAQYNGDLGRRYVECERWRDSIIARISSLRPTLVVITNGHNDQLIDGSDRFRMSASERGRSIWQQGLTQTIARIAGSTNRILVLQDTPWPGFDVPTCIVKHIDEPSRCAFAESKGVDVAVERVEQAAVGTTPHAAFLSMNDVICERGQCPALVNGMLRYSDSHHLSVAFSQSLAPELSRRLTQLLRGDAARR